MLLPTFTLLLTLLSLTSQASAATWYFLRYYTPSGSKFTSFSGDLVIPTLPQAGTYYLWPGLQPTDGSGVYQNVLDGRSGTWWIGSGWCCSNPSLPWGGGFNTYAGETVTFNNALTSDGSGWASTLTRKATGAVVSDTFALASKSFNQVLFAIELTGVSWDFGPLEFKNVKITSTGTDSSWCDDSPENYGSASVFSISGVKASVSGSVVTCTMTSVILEKPA
ncbi:uncharacterized protein BCR38DRAFT_516698 [Pseudomassariella vexata]|uniref:Concanavalin A-like lectin/glucanase domain-containing protein n=1 Tax=Pseudomassariella vexata TaxID=1141098 RepID=A0A1Y2DW28_9PEZI|nr:uncharacterized protein BCR38DRAFT_516698 [Pseudomassariella vexata]ORY63389.1 hypothetical protein BCR38DRAFT_516698 [Pseudomassariella vexata]